MDMAQQIFLLVLSAVMPVLVGMIVVWLRERYSLEKIKQIEAELGNVDSIAYRAVRLAEDVIKGPGKGGERLEYACQWASEQLKERGVDMEPSEVEAFIRAMFNTLEVSIKNARNPVE